MEELSLYLVAIEGNSIMMSKIGMLPNYLLTRKFVILENLFKFILECCSPEAHIGRLFVGKEFEIREGHRIVGKGKIVRLLREDYQIWEEYEIVNALEKSGIGRLSRKKLQE